MKKKWLKRILIFMLLGWCFYLVYEFYLINYWAEKRYLRDKQEMVDNLLKNKDSFDKIRKTTVNLPTFKLFLLKNKKVRLELNFEKKDTISSYSRFQRTNSDPSFFQGTIDTISKNVDWSILIKNSVNDTHFIESLAYLNENFKQFEAIYESSKQINSINISNYKNHQLRILAKETEFEGLQYLYFFQTQGLERSSYLEENFVEKIDNHFYLQLFEKNGLICQYHPNWIIPE